MEYLISEQYFSKDMFYGDPVAANRFMTAQLEMEYNGNLLINDVHYKLWYIEKETIKPIDDKIELHVFKIFLNRVALKRLNDKVYNDPVERCLLRL